MSGGGGRLQLNSLWHKFTEKQGLITEICFLQKHFYLNQEFFPKADAQKINLRVGFRPRLCDNTTRNDPVAIYPGFSQEYIPERDLI